MLFAVGIFAVQSVAFGPTVDSFSVGSSNIQNRRVVKPVLPSRSSKLSTGSKAIPRENYLGQLRGAKRPLTIEKNTISGDNFQFPVPAASDKRSSTKEERRRKCAARRAARSKI